MKVKIKRILTQSDIQDIKKGYFQIINNRFFTSTKVNLVQVLPDNSNRFIYAFLKNNKLILDDLYDLFFKELTVGSEIFLTIERYKCKGASDDIKILISESSYFEVEIDMSPLISNNVINELKRLCDYPNHPVFR